MYVVYFFFTKFANDLWLVQRSLTKDYLRACSIFSSDGSILNSSRKRAKCGKKGLGKQLQCHVSCHCIFHQKRNLREEGGCYLPTYIPSSLKLKSVMVHWG